MGMDSRPGLKKTLHIIVTLLSHTYWPRATQQEDEPWQWHVITQIAFSQMHKPSFIKPSRDQKMKTWWQFWKCCSLFICREVSWVPQAVRREAQWRSSKAAPLPHDGQDRPPELLDDSADRRPAAAGAERGRSPHSFYYSVDLYKMYFERPLLYFRWFHNLWQGIN